MLTEFENKLHKRRMDAQKDILAEEAESRNMRFQSYCSRIPESIEALMTELEVKVLENPMESSYTLYVDDPFSGAMIGEELTLRESFETALREVLSDFEFEADHYEDGDQTFHYKIRWYAPSSVTPVEPGKE